MGTYVGKVSIGSVTVPIASSLFGICSTVASTAVKDVTCVDFNKPIQGVTIFVRFNYGNSTNTNVKLNVNNTGEYTITGNCLCNNNDVLAFTLDITEINNSTNEIITAYWRCIGNAAFPGTQTPSPIADVASIGTSGSYAHEDHVHNIVVGEGTNNGEVSIAGQNAKVKGINTAAYHEDTDFAASIHTHSEYATTANPTFTGVVTLPAISNSSSDSAAATKLYVDTKINAGLGAAEAMVFKGTLGNITSQSTITSVPDGNDTVTPSRAYKKGWTWRINTAGIYAGISCEIGDLLIAIADSTTNQNQVNNEHWTVAQTNIDGAVTGPAAVDAENTVVLFNGTSGKVIKDSGKTLGTSVPSGAVFTDTTYTLTDGSAYTSHTLTGESGASILANVTDGVLALAPGIKFTTTNVGTSISSSTSGPT